MRERNDRDQIGLKQELVSDESGAEPIQKRTSFGKQVPFVEAPPELLRRCPGAGGRKVVII